MLPQTITEKYIKNMNWRDFELFVAKVLTWNDYNTIVTPPSNDEGKDIVAKKNNVTFYIECKHWKNQIGREHLEKLVGAAARDGIRNIIFVTTSYLLQQVPITQMQKAMSVILTCKVCSICNCWTQTICYAYAKIIQTLLSLRNQHLQSKLINLLVQYQLQ